MSEENKVPARGERAAIGGYLPQFDEFAWFVYLNLINRELEWIRIADHKAGKLDDIQYSTHSEIHAYQVKWTIDEANISFANFIELFPLIASSWKTLKTDNPTKKITPHLITNKSASSHDNIKENETKIGSFYDFISEVWKKLKSKQTIDERWNPIIDNLKKVSTLNDSEFHEFIYYFDFQPNYKQKKFSVDNIKYSKEKEDLQQISRFIVEQVANPNRVVEFSRQEIIQKLGWTDRFRTSFNHELIVDRQKYQPIQSTIDLLNTKLTEHKNGYLFLVGGPGSGKSTLLNQWSKGLKLRVVKYYAFDFVNPSSHLNFYERGNATYLFFDLVFQLKDAGIYKREVLPYKDIVFLKEVFAEQLKAIGEDYLRNGQPTIIIIDGLDHVPREYKSVTNSFLRELPLPSSLPEGVFIVLGSQTYEFEDLPQEVKGEFQRENRTIAIDPLKKEEVYKYLDTFDTSVQLANSQKLKIFEKSQGHPLYLSYLVEKVIKSNSIDQTIELFDAIEGNIDNYYKKIWSPIQQDTKLVQLLGLIARINGIISLHFVKEWGFEYDVHKAFNEKARILFNENDKNLTFFHNSFRQFLLYQTSFDYLINDFDSKRNQDYHSQLAEFYKKSSIEKPWKQNFHLYQAQKYEEFILEVTPDSFTEQLLNFRPADEIKKDCKLGIEIARQTKNLNILVRYLLSLAEIEKRLFNIDPASLTEELLILNKFEIASGYLRTGNILHCNEAYALKASRLFIENGYRSEGTALFNLAYPEIVTDTGITIDDEMHRYDETKDTLEEWVYTAPYFETTESILSKVENIKFSERVVKNRCDEKESDLSLILLTHLAYSLADQNKWHDFELILKRIDTSTPKERDTLFQILQYAIEQCLDLADSSRATEYLSLLRTYFPKEKVTPIGKIYIAELIYKVTQDIDETGDWIEGVNISPNAKQVDLDYKDSLDPFLPLIKLNKLQNLCGNGISITTAVPSVKRGSDEEILVEFERMLCLTTQILTDGILQTPVALTKDITKRVFPIVRFYYKEISHRNRYWYKLKESKGSYFDYLIYAVSKCSPQCLENLGNYLFQEFENSPKYWGSSLKRKIIVSLLENGFNQEIAQKQLIKLEESMFVGHDIDGRINECLAHSNAWLKIGKFIEGEKWLKQAIQESIGIGYSKDYQFSSWIKWLKITILKNPEDATKRIKWFLSHLNHIKETTEGKAYWDASEELLEVAYEHNHNDGFEQTAWQLEHNLIDFNEAMSLFIKFFVERTKSQDEFVSIVQLYTHLYLLLSESTDLSLLQTILSKGHKILERKFFVNQVLGIISAINIKAYEINRHYLLSEINNFFLSSGMKIENYLPDFRIPEKKERTGSSESSNILELKTNNESLHESEVLKRSVNYDDLKNFVQDEDVRSYFNWSNVLENITPLLSTSQIEEIANISQIRRRESDFYAKLSIAAFEKGDVELAEKLANKSLESSSESGWIKYMDGGTRITAFNALRRINSELSSEKAFEVFSHDIASTNYPSTYITHLDEIIPLLVKTYNEEEIWFEIFGYLQRVMANSNPTEDLPVLSSINQPIIETLVDYLMYLLKTPVVIVKEQSTILFAKYIDQGNSYAFNQLIEKKLDDYLSMDVIMALFELKSIKVNDLLPRIKEFAISKDYQLRDNASQILAIKGEEIPIPPIIDLPQIYSLHIPETKKPDFNKPIDPYFPDIDINDPLDLIRPFEYYINILYQESGIDESNLIYRTCSIMKQIGNKEEWTVDYEKKLRYHLEEVNLKYSYPRPRVIAAQRAIMCVVNELIDSGIIDDIRIRGAFRSHDYTVPLFGETVKPSFIPRIEEKEFGGVNNDWLNRIAESSRLAEPLLDYGKDFKIIAEYTMIKNLDWGAPTEEYMSQIAVSDKLDEENHYIFGAVFHQLSKDYHYLRGGGHFIVVIRDHRFNQFELKSRWIAINPVLARYLGWEPESNKLFAWKNSKGSLMAESIYWSNGNIHMDPRKDGEVGEGWFVIVSKEGLDQIKLVEKNLFIQKKLTRSKYDESVKHENKIFNVISI